MLTIRGMSQLNLENLTKWTKLINYKNQVKNVNYKYFVSQLVYSRSRCFKKKRKKFKQHIAVIK